LLRVITGCPARLDRDNRTGGLNMGDNVTHLSEATFSEEVNASDVPVVVDFWAEWCGPCKMIAPLLDEIASENAGKIRIVKVNVDDNPGLARQFDVMSIPTLMVFSDGEVKRRLVGAKGKAQLLEDLNEFL
jgi:thioredoxin 1